MSFFDDGDSFDVPVNDKHVQPLTPKEPKQKTAVTAKRAPAKRKMPTKMEKMRKKHAAHVRKTASEIVSRASEQFADHDMDTVSGDIRKSQIEATTALSRSKAFLGETSHLRNSFSAHSGLLSRMVDANQTIESQIQTLSLAADVIQKQEQAIAELTKKLAGTVRALGELSAKSDVASRRAIASAQNQNGSLVSADRPLVQSDMHTIQQKWIDCSGISTMIDPVEHPRSALVTAANGGSAIGLSTRTDRQIGRGEPGSNLVAFSIARARVDPSCRVQAQVSRRHQSCIAQGAGKKARVEQLERIMDICAPMIAPETLLAIEEKK